MSTPLRHLDVKALAAACVQAAHREIHAQVRQLVQGLAELGEDGVGVGAGGRCGGVEIAI
jgi:hypothetical protein